MHIDEIENLPTETLFELANTIRTETYRNTVTYSPKVFIPLTKLCQDRCGYCTFAEPPARVEAPYMQPEEILSQRKNRFLSIGRISKTSLSQSCKFWLNKPVPEAIEKLQEAIPKNFK